MAKKYDFALTWINSEQERFVQWLKAQCKLHKMSMIVAGLAAKGTTDIDDISCIDKSFPDFTHLLRTLIQ